MDFRISGLAPEPFQHLYGQPDDALAAYGVIRTMVDESPGFPDRIEMREGRLGETMLLLNHVSQPAQSPYRASHAIFVREGAVVPFDRVNEVPDVMRTRLLSLRGFDRDGMIRDAEVVQGDIIEEAIERLFKAPDVICLHAHNAARGCYSGRITRV